jgi:ligand-binding sensor domain-containing protein/signal transduction histidine kinase
MNHSCAPVRLMAFVLLSLFAALPCGMVSAQRYPFYNINIEDGLIQSQPGCLVQDKFGHLWIGTLGGLSRFDGHSFINYTIREGLRSNAIHALAADREGNIWIGSAAGLTRFDGRQMQHFTFHTAENPGANNVTSIRIAEDGTVWCLAAGKVYAIREGKSAAFNLPDHIFVTALLPDGDALWLATGEGSLMRIHDQQQQTIALPAVAGVKPYITRLHKDRKNTVWILTNVGLYRLNGTRPVRHTVRGQGLEQFPTLLCMAEDAEGDFWIGTSSGVIRLNDSSLQFYNKKNGLSNNNFLDILADREGNVWLASDGQGLFRFSGAVFTALDESMGLPSAQVMGITSARTGRLYLGTYDAGLYEYDNGEIRRVPFPANLRQAITSLATRNGYEIWIGTRGEGLWRYHNGVFHAFFNPAYPLPSNFVITLYADKKNRMWIGYNTGAAVYERDTFRTLPLKASSAKSFLQIGEDSMLIATNNGLKLYDGDSVFPYITNTLADNAQPQCLTLSGSELWIGTSDHGIIAYDMATRKATVYDKSNGLHSDFIYNITLDNKGDIWAGTGSGIHRISFTGALPVIRTYGKEQGVTGMESNHNAVHKMSDGSIWFGTTNGALRYNPSARLTSATPGSVVMQSVKVFGENIADTSWYDSTDAWYHVPYNLRLPYRRNNITFNFHAISLSGNEQLRYRYRIGGLEAPWSTWSTVTSVTFSALPPGNYDFIVQCITENDGAVKELHYPFEIIAPFHKTNLFRLVILAGCILLGILLQYIANRRKQNRQKLLEKLRREEQAKVRERTAEDFHDEVGNKLTRINVLANVLKTKIPNPSPDTFRLIEQIQENTSLLYSGTKDILWSLKPSNDTLWEILHRIRDVGVELFQDTEIEFTFTGTEESMKQLRLPMDVSRNLIMIFKEAMNNCLKYAGATEVQLEAVMKDRDVLKLKLTDNGQGFDIHYVRKGHGLKNMQVRAERIRGRLYIDAQPGKGTIITLSFRVSGGRDEKIPS